MESHSLEGQALIKSNFTQKWLEYMQEIPKDKLSSHLKLIDRFQTIELFKIYSPNTYKYQTISLIRLICIIVQLECQHGAK